MALAVYGGRPDREVWLFALVGIFIFLSLFAAGTRAAMHDLLPSLGLWGRLAHIFLASLAFLSPMALRGHAVLPEGFVLMLPLLLPLVTRVNVLRFYLAVTLVGFGLTYLGGSGPGLAIVLGFGATTLLCFSSAHFALTGEPFGLHGWWPIRQVIRTAVVFFIPAGLASALVYRIWPDLPVGGPPAADAGAEVSTAELLERVGRARGTSTGDFVLEVILGVLLVLAAIILIHLARRMLSHRARPKNLPLLKGSDVSELDYESLQRPAATVGLPGSRGEIVRLWWRWARRHSAADAPGAAGETAAEIAVRVAAEHESHAPASELTSLLERAHYGQAEPTEADVEAMRELVRDEIEREG